MPGAGPPAPGTIRLYAAFAQTAYGVALFGSSEKFATLTNHPAPSATGLDSTMTTPPAGSEI